MLLLTEHWLSLGETSKAHERVSVIHHWHALTSSDWKPAFTTQAGLMYVNNGTGSPPGARYTGAYRLRSDERKLLEIPLHSDGLTASGFRFCRHEQPLGEERFHPCCRD